MQETQDLSVCRRVWLGREDETNATRLFRRRFRIGGHVSEQTACLSLFADSRYHLWVNGTHVGRGPTFFHPHRRPVDIYDIAAYLRPGENVVAVLVHSVGIALHNYVPAGCPGLVARLELRAGNGATQTIVTDASWKATAQTGWRTDTPQKTWAIGFVESFDARIAPAGWQEVDFNDTAWLAAEEHPQFQPGAPGVYHENSMPRLRFSWIPVRALLRVGIVPGLPHELRRSDDRSVYAAALMAEKWDAGTTVELKGRLNDEGGGIVLESLTAGDGVGLSFDLGRQHTGAVCFTLECESEGTVDVGWSEVLEDGRPQMLRKKNSYADRYVARPGKNLWMPFNFSAGRYVCLILRGFTGRVRLHRIGMLASEPELDWSGSFACSDPTLNDIWALGVRTVRVGTQESLMDCPTREQAAYVGDGNPTASWIGRLTGDYSYWRELIRETFAVQNEEGQIKSIVFSGMRHILLDYSLLAIVGARDYLLETGDRETIHEILPACGKLLGWYRARCNAEGLFDLPWESLPSTDDWVRNPASAHDTVRDPGYNIFIDHPGLGWHNQNEPGIDRRGLNAAMNALLVLALRAAAEMMEEGDAGAAGDLSREADRLAAVAGQRFWNPAKGVFADGVLDGRLLPQISQQTNTWCIAAGFADAGRSHAVLQRILDPADTAMARSGPYFWYYMYGVLANAGMMNSALSETRRLWSKMLAGGATTAWETFAGDHLDSFCHPWSAAPVDFLLRHVAGIGSLPAEAAEIELRPRPDVLDQVEARVMTRRGPVILSWHREGRGTLLQGELPAGIAGRVCFPEGGMKRVTGRWTMQGVSHEKGCSAGCPHPAESITTHEDMRRYNFGFLPPS